MTGWLYRLLYRREIRERHERLRAFGGEMQRRVDESMARADAEDVKLKAFLAKVKEATTAEEVLALLDGWDASRAERRPPPVDQAWLRMEDT